MQKIKNVTQTVPYYLMPQSPLTGLTGSEPKPASPALGARWIFFMMRIVNYLTS